MCKTSKHLAIVFSTLYQVQCCLSLAGRSPSYFTDSKGPEILRHDEPSPEIPGSVTGESLPVGNEDKDFVKGFAHRVPALAEVNPAGDLDEKAHAGAGAVRGARGRGGGGGVCAGGGVGEGKGGIDGVGVKGLDLVAGAGPVVGDEALVVGGEGEDGAVDGDVGDEGRGGGVGGGGRGAGGMGVGFGGVDVEVGDGGGGGEGVVVGFDKGLGAWWVGGEKC